MLLHKEEYTQVLTVHTEYLNVSALQQTSVEAFFLSAS